MVSMVAEFFGICGLDMVPPDNLAELIPYILQIVVGVCLVSAVFGVIGHIADVITNWRRW